MLLSSLWATVSYESTLTWDSTYGIHLASSVQQHVRLLLQVRAYLVVQAQVLVHHSLALDQLIVLAVPFRLFICLCDEFVHLLLLTDSRR